MLRLDFDTNRWRRTPKVADPPGRPLKPRYDIHRPKALQMNPARTENARTRNDNREVAHAVGEPHGPRGSANTMRGPDRDCHASFGFHSSFAMPRFVIQDISARISVHQRANSS